MNYPDRWGFLTDPKDWCGKTILRVERVRMEWACIWDFGLAVAFTDGSRGFVVGNSAKGIITNPDAKAVEACSIFRPEEYGEMVADQKRWHEALQRAEEERQRQEYERLKERFG